MASSRLRTYSDSAKINIIASHSLDPVSQVEDSTGSTHSLHMKIIPNMSSYLVLSSKLGVDGNINMIIIILGFPIRNICIYIVRCVVVASLCIVGYVFSVAGIS